MNALTIARARSVCGPGVGDPLVFAALEHVELAVAAGRPVRRGEFLLQGREHVVVERALHDQERRERHRLTALEYLLRIAFVDRLPRIEVGLVVLDHPRALHLLRLLEARVRVADG